MGAYGKQCKGRCSKCGKYGYKPTEQKSPESKKVKKNNDEEESEYKRGSFTGVCFNCGKKG